MHAKWEWYERLMFKRKAGDVAQCLVKPQTFDKLRGCTFFFAISREFSCSYSLVASNPLDQFGIPRSYVLFPVSIQNCVF
jgi:hypothetical protein